jgi:DNA-binding response OmpR family regulator
MGLKILVAEDFKDLADSYRGLLETRGHEVIVTPDGVGCSTVFQQYATQTGQIVRPYFDIVILDQKMPYKDGVETAKEILFLNPKQKIVFITANPESVFQKLPQLPGNVLVLKKPFTVKELFAAVENFSVDMLSEMAKTVRK